MKFDRQNVQTYTLIEVPPCSYREGVCRVIAKFIRIPVHVKRGKKKKKIIIIFDAILGFLLVTVYDTLVFGLLERDRRCSALKNGIFSLLYFYLNEHVVPWIKSCY